MKNRRVTVFLVCLFLMQFTHAGTHRSPRVKTILVLGDSLSDGFRLNRSEAYPALLVQNLRAARLEFDVTNASQSGGTSDDGLSRLPPLLQRAIDIFILELGINDAFRGVPTTEIRENLQAIVDQVRGRNPHGRIIIAGMQMPNDAAKDYVSAFSQMYADLAAKNDAALVPSLLAGVAGDPNLNLPDRIHPNKAGHKILAENVWRVLEPIAREVSAER